MSYFATIGRVIGNLKGFYSGINGATLTGAIDVIVIEQPDGTYKCSPFHVRFGKLGVLRSKEKVVDIEINGESVPLRMKLGDTGEAFFVQEVESEDEFIDENLATSPLPGSPRLSSEGSPGGMKKGDSDDSEDGSPEVEGNGLNNDVAITIVEEEGYNNDGGSAAKEIKSDVKGKKRRRRRRKNQNSKTDIKLEMPPMAPVDAPETIFKMDEDLSHVVNAVKEMELERGSGPTVGIPHNRSFHRDFYSDTEVETNTPHTSRPSTPIQSDSEYECSKVQKAEDEECKWVWGELPSTVQSTPVTTPTNAQSGKIGNGAVNKSGKDEHAAMSSDDEGNMGKDRSSEGKSMFSMFSFMKRNPNQATSASNASASDNAPGIYLDDLNFDNMDPETAALYFPSIIKELRDLPKPEHDDDGESGKGSSLPQSPAPGSSPKASHMPSHMEEHRIRQRQDSSSDVVFEAISLCGANLSLFEQSQITYDELVENPDVLLNASPDSIVVKMNGKLVPWMAALPQLLSSTFFKRPLPSHIFQRLVDQCIKKDDSTSGHESTTSTGSAGKDPSKKSYSWFPWRRSQTQDQSADDQIHSSPESLKGISEDQQGDSPSKARKDLTAALEASGAVSKVMPFSVTSSSDESEGTGGKEDKRNSPSKMNQISNPSVLTNVGGIGLPEKFKKTLRLTTEQLEQLGLQYGQNEALFSVTTAYQGTSVARCHIYLWKWDDRVVVSDIDGTITKSDVLGHILPIIGNDWAQSGVAQLFTQIQDNGYKMLYLSARAIGQAQITREYLRSIKQGDVTLPDGPLLLNPTSLMSALHREVIEKKPEEFKIACLKDIQTLFPENPFYAGYGNKINDVWSYRAVDINISRIFTINHKGELRHALTNTFQSSYVSLVELAEHIFPAYKSADTCSVDGYTSFEFWRLPIPQITEEKGDGASPPTVDAKGRARPRSYTIA